MGWIAPSGAECSFCGAIWAGEGPDVCMDNREVDKAAVNSWPSVPRFVLLSHYSTHASRMSIEVEVAQVIMMQ